MSHKNTILPRNPERALQELIRIFDSLDAVYTSETEALERADAAAFMGVQDEKLHHANLYQTAMAELMARKSEMVNVPPALKQTLKERQDQFSEMVQRNLKALERMKRLSNRLGETLHKAARDNIRDDQGRTYRHTGQLHENTDKAVSMGVSETA